MSSLRRSLQSIYDERGQLTAPLVVDEARDEASPLHAHFEWDDAVAGEQHRLHQARQLIRSVRVTYRRGDEDVEVRRYFSVERTDPPERVYEDIDEVLTDPLKRQIALAQMEREFRTWKRRWQHMSEYADILRRESEGDAA